MLTNCKTLKDLLLCSIFFFVANYCYYASNFALEALKLNIYFNSIFSALADLIGCLLVPIVLKNVPRKKCFMVAYIVVILAAIGFYITPIPQTCLISYSSMCYQKLLHTLLAACIKVVISLTFGNVTVYVSEIFPSLYRSMGVAITMGVGRSGAIIAPFISNLLK